MLFAVGTAGTTEDIASSASELLNRLVTGYPFEEGFLSLPLSGLHVHPGLRQLPLNADAAGVATGHALHMRNHLVHGVHQLLPVCQEFQWQTLSVHKRQAKHKFVPGALAGEYS